MTNVWVLDHKKKVIKIDHELNVFGIKIDHELNVFGIIPMLFIK